MIDTWEDIAGIIGVVIIIASYFLLQIEKVESNSVFYLTANLIGAILIIISLLCNWNLSSFIIEVLWALISIYGLIKNLLNKKT